MYLAISSLVGAAQVADAIILFRARGVSSKALALFAFAEYIWAGVSLASFRSIEPSWLPISFVAYVAIGVVIGVMVQARERTGAGRESPSSIVPLWFVIAGGCFGAYFCAASVYTYVQA